VSIFPTIDLWLETVPMFILHGPATADLHLCEGPDGALRPIPLTARLARLCADAGFEHLVIVDPVAELQYEALRPGVTKPDWLGHAVPRGPQPPLRHEIDQRHRELAALLEVTALHDELVAIVVVDAPAYVERADHRSPEEQDLFVVAEGMARFAVKHPTASGRAVFNPVFFLAANEARLPESFRSNPRIRSIPVTEPTREDRRCVAKLLLDDEDAEQVAVSTSKMSLAETQVAATLVARQTARPRDAATMVRLGQPLDRWRDPALLERLPSLHQDFASKVLGQPQAVAAMVDQIGQAIQGIGSFAERAESGHRRPKFSVLLVGPTGTGKGELCRASQQFIFGAGAPTTIDCSEFKGSHAMSRLLGTHAGYVGYGDGGQLPNAVKQNPYQIIQLDEVEKADPVIFDALLQVLDEGRIRDNTGATCYLDQIGLIATSNLGQTDPSTARPRWNQEHSYEEIRQGVLAEVERYFGELSRPEVLARFDAVIVMDLLRPEAAAAIFDALVSTVVANFRDQRDQELVLAPPVVEALRARCTANLHQGGRGIKQELKRSLLNPLAEYLTHHPTAQRLERLEFSALEEADGRCALIGR